MALPASVRDRAQLLEERCGERIPRLAAKIHDLDVRQPPAEPPAQLEPLEPLPALGSRRRASVDRDRAFQGGALRRDGARVVAGVGLLLVGGVVLLVDADQAESLHRREDSRPGSHDDARLAGGDSLSLVAPLRIGHPRVENGDPAGEAGREASERLRCQRDLGDEDDRPEAAGERLLAGAQVDLRFPASGGAVEEEGAAGPERVDDPPHRSLLLLGELLGSRLRGERLRALTALGAFASRPRLRRDERESARRSRAVVVGEPECEIDERRRDGAENALDGNRLDLRRSLVLEPDHDPAAVSPSEGNGHDRALLEAVREIGERPRESARGHQRVDRGEAGHR